MKIAIFGMGYVGCVSAVCLASKGHDVIGVDISPEKIDLLQRGVSPVIESGVPELVSTVVSSGKLKVIKDTGEAIRNSELCFVCVGTPSRNNGDLELNQIYRVTEKIGLVLKNTKKKYLVVYRSTVLPGTMERNIIPLLESNSKMEAGKGFEICYNPEFLREGSSISDFYNPSKTVIGSFDKSATDAIERLYNFIDAPLYRTSIKVAEMIKYTDNAFHALKIGFANEIGSFCKRLGIDSWKVMDIFCADTKLNISDKYLKPGFAFGGSCLPKDLRALNYKAKTEDLELPILNSILNSNRIQIINLFNKILEYKKKKVGFLGFSFKEGTDDLRESPFVALIEFLLGKGFQIKIYDKNVNLSKLFGANKRYLEQHIPHIASLMRDRVEDVISNSEIIIVGHKSHEFIEHLSKINENIVIFDLVKAFSDNVPKNIVYEGISW